MYTTKNNSPVPVVLIENIAGIIEFACIEYAFSYLFFHAEGIYYLCCECLF